MENNSNTEDRKRSRALLIPYRKTPKGILVYLQRRDKDVKTLPDFFGFFGGKIDPGETAEQAVIRETKEELDYVLQNYYFFKAYTFAMVDHTRSSDVFIMEVSDNFEKEIKILEGQYGKWFSEEEIKNESRLSENDKRILRDFYEAKNQK